METKHRIMITIAFGVLLLTSFYFISYSITKYTGLSISDPKQDNFESCLKEKDIALYINTENIAETLKEVGLGNYLKDFKIMNCLRNNQVCSEKGISFFPTWIIENNKIERDISISELTKFSGCKF